MPHASTHALASKTMPLVDIQIPLFLWSVIQFFTPTSTRQAYLQYENEKSI
jgi:hypothetical protein